ncbi:MAG: HD domain-containing protein [Holosporales bacterium]|jgi:HD superfamily phosphodiesterase|nr:HD domain-containing protein [Holosporales bacterium]
MLGHSGLVARAAFCIAQKTGNMDPAFAHACGLFHDIAKLRLPKEKMYKHPLLGHAIMKDAGRPDIAKICLTHSFPNKNASEYILFYCKGDVVEAEAIRQKLKDVEYDFAVQLIQLCDKISGHDRYLTIEQKRAFYLKKYGFAADFIDRIYDDFFEIKRVVDSLIGEDLYAFLNIE